MKSKNKKILVAMSGGVDSSVAAALLKKQEYNVVGVFMHFWGPRMERGSGKRISRGSENLCCSERAEKAARSVAAKLKIPFYVFNFEKEFKKAVVDYFLNEQARGRTPNPCVVCNKKIKFGLLFKKALAMGADFVATGHYARLACKFKVLPLRGISRREKSSKFKVTVQNSKLFKLLRAEDEYKDQSYFLYVLTQQQLSRVLFPLGNYTKKEVYQLAKKWHLPYRRQESFDLCFAGSDTESFLKKYLKLKPGKIMRFCHYNSPQPSLNIREGAPPLNLRGGEGELLGYHQGLALYTIGQRKNLVVPNGPWWVVKKDNQKNILYVSHNEEDLYSQELIAGGINWIGGKAPKLPLKALVKIRYRSEAAEAVIKNGIASPAERDEAIPWSASNCRDGHGVPLFVKSGTPRHDIKVVFKNPQRAVTPGQSVVFYSKKGEVLGGGVIES